MFFPVDHHFHRIKRIKLAWNHMKTSPVPRISLSQRFGEAEDPDGFQWQPATWSPRAAWSSGEPMLKDGCIHNKYFFYFYFYI